MPLILALKTQLANHGYFLCGRKYRSPQLNPRFESPAPASAARLPTGSRAVLLSVTGSVKTVLLCRAKPD